MVSICIARPKASCKCIMTTRWITIFLLLLSFSKLSIVSSVSASSTKNFNKKSYSNSKTMAIDRCPDMNLDFLEDLRKKYSHQPTFLQAVEEMAMALLPLFRDEKDGKFYQRAFLALTEPERTISFKVPWEDDKGNIQINRGWRVEFSRQVIEKYFLYGYCFSYPSP